MATSNCTYPDPTAFNHAPLPTDNNFDCFFASNLTLASKCCAPGTLHTFGDSKCYSTCEIPSNITDTLEQEETNNPRDSANPLKYSILSYFNTCLNTTGEVVGSMQHMMCQARPHVVHLTYPDDYYWTKTVNPFQTNPASPAPPCVTSDFAETVDFWGYDPVCGYDTNSTRPPPLEPCCYVHPLQSSGAQNCWWLCPMFRITEFTKEQMIGEMQACMLNRTNNSKDAAFDGLKCRLNKSSVDLRATTFPTPPPQSTSVPPRPDRTSISLSGAPKRFKQKESLAIRLEGLLIAVLLLNMFFL
jgi:hypothetical protein